MTSMGKIIMLLIALGANTTILDSNIPSKRNSEHKKMVFIFIGVTTDRFIQKVTFVLQS